MRAVILGAGRGIRRRTGDSTPKSMVEGPAGWRVLDWQLNALRSGGEAREILFVAGDDLEQLRAAYPELTYHHNAQWADQHVVGSLFSVDTDFLDRGFLFTYADTVYRPDTVAALRASEADIAIVVDRRWRDRYQDRDLADAEKVVLAGDRVRRIGKDLPADADIDGEFIGLACFRPRGAALLRSLVDTLRPVYAHRPYRSGRNLDNACLSDLLQEVVDQGGVVQAVCIDGDWAELDDPRDLAQFVFGTKAETLERLRPLLRSGHIHDGVRLRVGEWLGDPQHHAAALASRFPEGPVAVRSSARAEDGFTASAAGRYTSVLGVEGGNATALQEAVEQVVASYDQDPDDDQVLIQPCLTDVAMAGVMMTRELDRGADYVVVHYDDQTGHTDTVTNGTGTATHTVWLRRDAPTPPADPRLRDLLETASELESITGSDALDVEFAVDREGALHVLQVRPIAAQTGWPALDRDAVADGLASIRDYVARRLRPAAGVPGSTTILGQMPDWNPAEMIGPFPAPLSRSLYEHLITHSAWRRARARLGYADLPGQSLMVELAGRPYVDVRLSANNLLPASLDAAVRGRIVDAGLRRLAAHPELHDKIEFEVWATTLDLDFDTRAAALVEAGLPQSDVEPYREALHEQTTRLILDGPDLLRAQSDAAATLAPACDALWATTPLESTPDALATLLDQTVERGTLPFSIAARLAFVATSILRSLAHAEVVDPERLAGFLGGVQTVSSDFVRDLARLRAGELERGAFLRTYGHLRPGAYDIESPRYDATPDLYLHGDAPVPAPAAASDFPTAAERHAIDRALKRGGVPVPTDLLLRFATQAIAARESIKLQFTRNLSAALEALAAWGLRFELRRADLALLEIDDVLALAGRPVRARDAANLCRRIADRRLDRERHAGLVLPGLITSVADLDCVRESGTRPNFVGRGRHQAEVAHLDRGDRDLEGRIVVVEGADPGYDWIFGHRIAGLVTRYGGANSHMTIRCAEFGLPAAIGCGDALYRDAATARRLQLDCDRETLHVLA